MATVTELETRLEALRAQRDSAVARVSYDGRSVEYRGKATPVAQIRRALLEARAVEDEATAIRSQVRPATVGPTQPAIDTAAIYAARNQNVR